MYKTYTFKRTTYLTTDVRQLVILPNKFLFCFIFEFSYFYLFSIIQQKPVTSIKKCQF